MGSRPARISKAAALGARAAEPTIRVELDDFTPALVNDAALAKKIAAMWHNVLGKQNVLEIPPIMGGEDFARYGKEVPIFFYFLGTRRPGTVSGDHHTPTFTADDGAVPVGMRAMSFVILDYLTREARASSGRRRP